MSEQYLLEMKGIHKSFPGVKALQNVGLQLKAGEVHALLGENGAGKSTLIKVLGGIYHAEEGEIYIDGQKAAINGVVAAREAGISIVHQELVLVPYMTVAENIFLGREPGSKMNINRKQMTEEAQKLMDTYEMNINADTLVEHLTIAQQQMVEIVKAISFNSKILVMDEPTSSISDKEVGFLFETMRALTKKGVGIIYISHKMEEIYRICDRVLVLRDGQTINCHITAEVEEETLIEEMVGRKIENLYPKAKVAIGSEVLRVEHLSVPHPTMKGKNIVDDVSFHLNKGEILGIGGLVGAGRSEILGAVFGQLYKGVTKEVSIEGKKTTIKNPSDAIEAGLGFVTEERKLNGFVWMLSIRDNMYLASLKDLPVKGAFVDVKEENRRSQAMFDRLRIKAPSIHTIVNTLSGGNQQKVVLSKWLVKSPRILFVDEPTKGVDVGAKAEIYTLMGELVKSGISIVMVSSDLPELLAISDRVLVVSGGRITGEFNREEMSEEAVMRAAIK